MLYSEIKSQDPVLEECFFAFSNKQFEEGIEKMNLKDKKIYRGPFGLFGTQEGLSKVWEFYRKQKEKVAEECTPQEVYEYEFANHECGYTGTDEEAIDVVIDYFGVEKARTVKRRYGWTEI